MNPKSLMLRGRPGIHLVESVGQFTPVICPAIPNLKSRKNLTILLLKSARNTPHSRIGHHVLTWCSYCSFSSMQQGHQIGSYTLRSMILWFFAIDRINCSHYASCYWLEMSLMAQNSSFIVSCFNEFCNSMVINNALSLSYSHCTTFRSQLDCSKAKHPD